MSITVSIGQLTGGANDLINAYNAWASGTPVLPPTGYAEPAFTAFGGILSLAGELTSGPLGTAIGTTAPLVAAINLAGAYSQYQTAKKFGDDAATVSAILGVAGSLGNFLATVPTPQTRAIGTLVNLAAGAAKTAWDNGWRPSLGPLPDGAQIPPDDTTYDPLGNPTGVGTPAISPTLGTTPDPLVKTIRYVDPLILDLDGDGLEITPLSAGILFDANGDTVKTGTAWAGADDGLLVWDRNANGQIDAGSELFGDETILANGSKAAHGFAALAELDSNANGKFDALDAQYAHLRIWRDVNQDGISQAAELKTLAETGVASITLGSTATTTNYGDAILARSGTFTRADGSSGQAGSFILAQNNFVRQFVPITVSAAAQALPNIAGSGWVRDLQEAATQSPALIDLLHNVQNASTRAGYRDAVASLLRTWGNDSGYSSASDQALANGYGLIMSDPLDAQEAGWMDVAIKGSAAARDAFRAALSATDLTKFDAMRERMVGGLERVHSYERTACAKRVRHQINSYLCNVRMCWKAKVHKKYSVQGFSLEWS